MKRLCYFLPLLLLLFACDESSQLEDKADLEKLYAQIVELSESVPCENADDWRFTSFGESLCGGPKGYIPYASSIDTVSFLMLVELYTNKEISYNAKYEGVQICQFVYYTYPLGVECVEGKAEIIYNNDLWEMCSGSEKGHLISNQYCYESTYTEGYEIEDAVIEGDSLSFTLHSSGCDGNSWEVALIDSEVIAESYPVQRYFKVSLTNTEACFAVISKTYTIDISALKNDSDKTILHIEGLEESLLYE
ncbi:hypothetical protein [Sediminitomix flava]|uniref:DUF4377 domain-containing protein n=1 Tax=Sediminitomix flava TaxID=379075 RepID=A0A315ZBX5_SEDFL|nr:hypothetical protein [Sediminitomix flava]PWJ42802.1 hypothetical protein BC781_102348 [Sediminitomix flava]